MNVLDQSCTFQSNNYFCSSYFHSFLFVSLPSMMSCSSALAAAMDVNHKILRKKKKKKVRFVDEVVEFSVREKIDKNFVNGRGRGRGRIALGIPVNSIVENPDASSKVSRRRPCKSVPKLLLEEPFLKSGNHKRRGRCLPASECTGPYVNISTTGPKSEDAGSPKKGVGETFRDRLSRWNKAADNLAENLWIHLNMAGSISETIKGKLSLGAKIVTEGGVDNLYKMTFMVGPHERLLKTSACYLSTDSGPMAGLLFISTEKLSFCSERPISLITSKGATTWSYYKVTIPLLCLGSVSPSENVFRPVEKYIHVQTVDGYEFWFMGFVHYDRALRYMQQAVLSRKSSVVK